MKAILALAVIAASATAATAQSTTARVPTGIDVKGSTHYVMDGNKVVQVDCTKHRYRNNPTINAACYRAPSTGEAPVETAAEAPGATQ